MGDNIQGTEKNLAKRAHNKIKLNFRLVARFLFTSYDPKTFILCSLVQELFKNGPRQLTEKFNTHKKG